MVGGEQPRLIAYIDESGDAGGKFNNGSSHFMVMAAVVFAICDEAKILTLFDEAREAREHQRKFRAFKYGSDKDNYVLTKFMALKPIRLIQTAFYKPKMDGSYVRSNPKAEYLYLTKFTIERISWLARTSARGGDPRVNQCKLVFSEQRMYSYDDIAAYLNKLQNGQGRYNCSADWRFIHEDMEYGPHQDEHAIHLADLSASALARAIEPKAHGMTDDRFQRNLVPAIFRMNGKMYGLKLFPNDTITMLRERGRLSIADLL